MDNNNLNYNNEFESDILEDVDKLEDEEIVELTENIQKEIEGGASVTKSVYVKPCTYHGYRLTYQLGSQDLGGKFLYTQFMDITMGQATITSNGGTAYTITLKKKVKGKQRVKARIAVILQDRKYTKIKWWFLDITFDN